MFDPGQKRGPLTTSEKWISGIFLAIFVGLFLVAVFHEFHPAKLERPAHRAVLGTAARPA